MHKIYSCLLGFKNFLFSFFGGGLQTDGDGKLEQELEHQEFIFVDNFDTLNNSGDGSGQGYGSCGTGFCFNHDQSFEDK